MSPENHVLPDYLAPSLDVVIVGSVVAGRSSKTGHYYSNPGNKFWERLHQAGLTPKQLRPEDDVHILAFGIGLTDLNKVDVASSDVGVAHHVDDFIARISDFSPTWIVFNGIGNARSYCEQTGGRDEATWGFQDWLIGDSFVFVAPSTSPTLPQGEPLDGKLPEQWWRELGAEVRGSRAGGEAAS